MSNIDKIRQEIERRIKSCDATSKTPNQLLWAELSALLPFLDALEDSECPEYCVRSHCIGCSKYNPDEWSNKPRKAKIKATGEIVEGFTDGQGHFDVFTDHNVCSRYDVSAVEFDALSEEPDKDLEEELDRFIASGKSVTVDDYGTYKVSYHDFKKVARHFAQWQKEQDEMSKVNYEGARAVYDNTVQHLQEKIDEKYELGKKDMKEQMMKEAVEGVVCYGSKGAYIETDFLGEYDTDVYGNPGNKVKIIIVKEDGQ